MWSEKRKVVRDALRVVCIAFFAALIATAQTPGATEKTLYQFQGGTDGYSPAGAMIADSAGNLYGTTMNGGTIGSCEGGGNGCGTVFQLKRPTERGGAWTESVIYTFLGSDGAFPQAPLITDGNGNLYGTAEGGGDTNLSCNGGCGVVFELSPPAKKGGAWKETVLHYFKGVPSGKGYGDGAAPNNIVFGADGNLYGTAYGGGYCFTDETGTYCYGSVFELEKPATPSGAWTEKPLYIFTGPTGAPQSAIFDKFGNLDGSVVWGAYGYGEIFSLAPTSSGPWTLTSLHDFIDGADGAFAVEGLTQDSAGNIYGATLGGGIPGVGVVFELQAPQQQGGAWNESVIYTFQAGSGGDTPLAGPTAAPNGNVYGTASEGGTGGGGTVFQLTPGSGGAWAFSALYNFTGNADGGGPAAQLNLNRFGQIFGTTSYGGTMGSGQCRVYGYESTCGVVFGLAP